MEKPLFDLPLAKPDLLELSSLDAITAFFAKLGYSTNARISHKPENLGIVAEGIRAPIQKVERIASQEGTIPFQVYFFQLKSVTVSHTRDLVRSFRDKAGNFLLVLVAPDYDKIHFALVDREPGRDLTTAVIPRVVTLERRNPDAIRIRALRRLTVTESDSISQYQKVKAAFVSAEWSDEHFNNRALFSDYYLNIRLQDQVEWKEDPKPAYQTLRSFFTQTSSRYHGKKESDLKTNLFEPLFKELGFSFKSFAHKQDEKVEPDYALFAPGDEKKPLAYALTYTWDRSLDGKDSERDEDWPEENPGAVVVSLLEKNEVPWVVVTNGKTWRLYSSQAHSRATHYYEVDIEDSLSPAQNTEIDKSFRYFWLFFRRSAFEEKTFEIEGKKEKGCFLDRVLKESQTYARNLGSDLKGRVFEQVFPELAEGFIENMRQKRGRTHDLTQDFLDEAFQGTLTLLYRLLFLFYAESRNLLPVREIIGYWERSLEKMRKEIETAAGVNRAESFEKLKKTYSNEEYNLYKRLLLLFKTVDKGDSSINIPMYNGGLFISEPEAGDDTPEADAARFLDRHAIPDLALAYALDLLSRDEDRKTGALALIDYKSLGVRQLGSIYEGLLEFKLRIAGEKLGIVKVKGKEVYEPFGELDEKEKAKAEKKGDIVKKGHAYLENDRRERKATGSYYTPDYIVKFIVDRTVGPILQEKLEQLRPKFRQSQERRRKEMEKQEEFKKKKMRFRENPPLSMEDKNLVDELFNLKVLDPAMGSGHFLVEAVDYVTDRMLAFLNAFTWNPVVAFLRETRDTILREMDDQFITLDPARLTDVNLLKRHILKRCIFGVDLNYMAVELSKVSLWLDCFTLGAPLSFLDHHLRCGNSLIGVSSEEVKETQESGQVPLFSDSKFQGLLQAVGTMISIGDLPDVTSSQVKTSRVEYQKASDLMRPHKRILDLFTSQWYGNKTKQDKYGERGVARDFLSDVLLQKWADKPEKTPLPPEYRKAADIALNASKEHRFFHWEFEFPEVFYGRLAGTRQKIELREDGGFDAVIGNPPYVRQEGLGGDKEFLQKEHKAVYSGVADLYVYFYHRGLSICRPGGRFGMITSNKYLRAGYGENLRGWLTSFAIEDLLDFGDLPLFDEAITYPLIFIAAKKHGIIDSKAKAVTVRSVEDAENIVELRDSFPTILLKDLRKEGWTLERPEILRLMEKIRKNGKPLGEIIRGKFYYGIKTGFNDAFLIDEDKRKELIATDPQSAELIKPFLRGQDIKRWKVDWAKLYLIMTEIGVDIKRYPAVFSHLKEFQKELEKRWDKGDHWWELRPCDYYAEFEKPKIIWPDISVSNNFAYDPDPHYLVNTAYILPTDDLALLALLNSKVTEFYYRLISSQVRGGYLRFIATYINEIRVPTYDQKGLSILVKKLMTTTSPAEMKEYEKEIDRIVEEAFGITSEEKKIIENG